jgi:hypothetical protein
MEITVFWDVKPCGVVDVSEECAAFIFRAEECLEIE